VKYTEKEYLNSEFYSGEDYDGITNLKRKIVKCRTTHPCDGGCDGEIKSGEYALCEFGFIDGEPWSSYNCMSCLDKWLDELQEIESDLE
jgi:hypothetical protein